jgi:hypothetical protein
MRAALALPRLVDRFARRVAVGRAAMRYYAARGLIVAGVGFAITQG